MGVTQARYTLGLTVNETEDFNSISTSMTGGTDTLTTTTTPAVSMQWADQRTLSGANETIDLTATSTPVRDFDGLTIVMLKLKAATGNNAGGLTFSEGGTNAFLLFGGATEQVLLMPGQELEMYFSTTGDVVSSTTKNILVAGTSGDVYDIHIVMG